MRYRFVAIERASFPVRMLCRLVGVAVSGFYAWLRRGPDRQHEDDRRMDEREDRSDLCREPADLWQSTRARRCEAPLRTVPKVSRSAASGSSG